MCKYEPQSFLWLFLYWILLKSHSSSHKIFLFIKYRLTWTNKALSKFFKHVSSTIRFYEVIRCSWQLITSICDKRYVVWHFVKKIHQVMNTIFVMFYHLPCQKKCMFSRFPYMKLLCYKLDKLIELENSKERERGSLTRPPITRSSRSH